MSTYEVNGLGGSPLHANTAPPSAELIGFSLPHSSKDHHTHGRKCRPRTFPYIRFSVVNRDFTIIEKTFKPLYVMLSAVFSVVVFCVFSKFFRLVRFHVFRAPRTTQEHPKRSQEHSESIRGSPKSVQEGSTAPQPHPFQAKL